MSNSLLDLSGKIDSPLVEVVGAILEVAAYYGMKGFLVIYSLLML